jgi:hypothetical protein
MYGVPDSSMIQRQFISNSSLPVLMEWAVDRTEVAEGRKSRKVARGIQTLGVPALVAAFVVSIVVYALDWASRDEDWKADDYARRLVYLVVNALILWLTVSGVITLENLGLG